MKDTERLPGASKSWSRRMLDFFRGESCGCSKGAACPGEECSCSCSDLCPVREWAESYAGSDGVEKPDRPTLNTVPVGANAHIEQIFLPLAQKKRLLSLGLTCGTKVGVVSNEKGRMIVAVRDSRLGLSPEVASRITYKSA
jgi:Fe2+ transport system protein FeoA